MKFLILPLVGGLIGYFTNLVAIRMLFWPYNPVQIAGLTLPFTPGMVPREKQRLGDSIGKTVIQLLTPEKVQERLIDEKVLAAASRVLDDVLDNNMVSRAIPKQLRQFILVRLLSEAIDHVPDLLQKMDLANTVSDTVAQYSNQEIEDLVVSVVKRELKAITWFGALLGAVIGLLQVVLI